jgi:hypothetical protein
MLGTASPAGSRAVHGGAARRNAMRHHWAGTRLGLLAASGDSVQLKSERYISGTPPAADPKGTAGHGPEELRDYGAVTRITT